jgi:ribosome maturation factor RimP
MEEKITSLIEETVNSLGFDIVKLSIQGGKSKVLQIMIDRLDSEKVKIADCRLVSRNVSALLDVEDVIADKYLLEVSSAGVERPLVKLRDFQKFMGREIKIVLREQVGGKLKYKGKITGVEDNLIILQSKNIEFKFDFLNVKNANLVLTDEMFRELLNKKKEINKPGEENE